MEACVGAHHLARKLKALGHDVRCRRNMCAPMLVARAREAALARASVAERRLETAKGEAKSGPTESSMLAGYIAHQTGGDAAEIARTIALAITGFAIVMTLLMAGLAHQAVSLVMRGLGVPVQIAANTLHPDAGQAAPARKKARDAAAKARAPKMPKTARPVPAGQQIAAFAHETFGVGVELTGAEVYELFSTWWRAYCPGELMPSQTVLSAALVEAGINREKRGGKIRDSAASEAVD